MGALGLTVALAGSAAATENFRGPLGVLSKKAGVTDGYVLIDPQQSRTTWLIDNDGNVINQWTSEHKGFYAELLPNGNLSRQGRLIELDETGLVLFGGVSGIIEEFDWDGNKVWEYRMYTPGKEVSHHTYEVMPNGNYLLLGWEYKSYDEAIAKGLDPNYGGRCLFKDGLTSNKLHIDGIWPDFIREVDHDGKTVWEWHVWDHLGKGKDKFDINVFCPPSVERVYAGPDWTHFNGVAYNPETDQIAVTSRNLGEVYIIDKKTGNIVYRWGNPANYGEGKFPSGYYDDGDNELFGPHAPDWTSDTTVSIFDNGDARLSANYSRAVEVDVTTGKIVWQWRPADVGTTPSNFYTATQGGCQKLPNGNWLITTTTPGHIIEVTKDKNIVWEYVNPVKEDKAYALANGHGGNGDGIHKALRYTPEWPGFQGKDMSPKRDLMPAGSPNWVEIFAKCETVPVPAKK